MQLFIDFKARQTFFWGGDIMVSFQRNGTGKCLCTRLKNWAHQLYSFREAEGNGLKYTRL